MWRAARRILKEDRQSRLGLSVEDLVSQTRLELMKTGRPPSADNMRAYLYRATYNQAAAVLDSQLKEGFTADPNSLPVPRHPGEAYFEEGVEDALILEQVDAYLDILEDDERHVYIQWAKHDRTLTDIAEDLGVSQRWASTLRTRAVVKLSAAAGIDAAVGSKSGKGELR
jgi:RNA polymerase sigma factor (sigma-70 family)